MKNHRAEKYGSTAELKYMYVEKPIHKDDGVLIKVIATSVNSWDLDLVNGKP